MCATLGPIVLESNQLARGNVAPLPGGAPDLPLVDVFDLADRLLIRCKALSGISC
ncbi:MAG: hypothetical protein HKM88_01960 [Halobacteria archaeon]|nr:hypothetical protein [Halobacteria archaeon]